MVQTPLLTVPEVADRLKLSVRTPYKPDWQERTGLRPVRVGRSIRFRLKDVEDLIAGQAREDPEARRRRRESDVLKRWAAKQGVEWVPPSRGAGP